MSRVVCVDASLAVARLFDEPFSDAASMLAQRWLDGGFRLVAPSHFRAEAGSAIYKRVRRNEIGFEEALRAIELFESQGVAEVSTPGLLSRALRIAAEHRLPSVYDAFYLAVADEFGCELWTGDERLYNSVKEQLPWVRWIGEWGQ